MNARSSTVSHPRRCNCRHSLFEKSSSGWANRGILGDTKKLKNTWKEGADDFVRAIQYAQEALTLVPNSIQYFQCMLTLPLVKFCKFLIGAIVDVYARKMFEHELNFDGNVGNALRDVGNLAGHAQVAVGGATRWPTHTQLAKDHDDHPLHDLAAKMAIHAVKDVGSLMQQVWRSPPAATEREVLDAVSSYFVHPWKIGTGDRAHALIDLARNWARKNEHTLRSVQDMDWKEHHAEHWEHVREKAQEMVGSAVGDDKVEWAINLVEEQLRKQGTIQ